MKTSVTCTAIENYQIQVRTARHAWIADEPGRLGGDDLGPNPFDLLLGRLGACMTITVYYHASEAGLAFERIWVDVEGEWKGEGDAERYHVHVTLRVRGELSDPELGQLEAIAARCPVKKLLAGGADITTEILRV
jgi:putative redox protein